MKPTIVLLGTLDTKGDEYRFLRDELVRAGCEVVIVNAGVTADPDYPVDFDRRAVAAAAGNDIDALVAAADRGPAVTSMAEGAASIVAGLFEGGRLDGIIGAGGSGGSSIISRAMRSLPVGVPKVLVSTLGGGDVSSLVGVSDMAVVHSVVDIAGINAISSVILANAAAAVAGMAMARVVREPVSNPKPLVGATMYGTTTPCVDVARRWLEGAGYEVLVFHATGAGGRSMEALIAEGRIVAALDITTTELTDEVAGGVMTAGADRLEIAGSMGVPQVVSLGAVDMITFTPPEAVPAEWGDRNAYAHNPSITLVRSNAAELRRVGRLIADKLNRSTGPTTLFLPLRGTSSYAVEGGVFYDPEADEALFSSLHEHLSDDVEVVEMDTDINDPEFALAMARTLDAHYRTWAASRE